jgi:hypothetical protein
LLNNTFRADPIHHTPLQRRRAIYSLLARMRSLFRPHHLCSPFTRCPPLIRPHQRAYASVADDTTTTMTAFLNALNPVAAMFTPPITPKESRSREQSREWGIVIKFHPHLLTLVATTSVPSCSVPQPSAAQNLLRLQNHLAALPTSLLKHMHLSKTRREDPRLFFQAMAADLVNL